MKIKVLAKVVHVGAAYGRKGDVIEVSEDVARALIKENKAEAAKATNSKAGAE